MNVESLISMWCSNQHGEPNGDPRPRPGRRNRNRSVPVGRLPYSGFTLVEMLLALAICAIVLVAINAVFASAVRLREHTSSRVAEALPVERTLEMLRRDLKGAVGPGGFLAGDFKCSVQTMGSSMGISGQAAGGSGLDFFTATGVLGD